MRGRSCFPPLDSGKLPALQSRQEFPGKEYSTQKLVLGTHTSDNEQNYLMIAEVQVKEELPPIACMAELVRRSTER